MKRDAWIDTAPRRQRIAVVGAGISGLASAWLLSRRYDVTLFEAAGYLGGHTNTVDVTLEGKTHPVDTGFLVYNERTYPNLIALFALLGVESVQTEMSFAVSLENPDLEWAGSNLATVFGQKRNLLRPQFWGMLADILRFNRESQAWLDANSGRPPQPARLPHREPLLGSLLGLVPAADGRRHLVLPDRPDARHAARHLHPLLPEPRPAAESSTARSGAPSRAAAASTCASSPRNSTTSASPARSGASSAPPSACASIMPTAPRTSTRSCWPATATRRWPSPAARPATRSARCSPRSATSPTAPCCTPTARCCRATRSSGRRGTTLPAAVSRATQPVGVSYLINRLQPLPFTAPVVVTLNPAREPDPATVIAEFDYDHPIFDGPAIAAQQRLAEVQGENGLWLAGAWGSYGFHEDGLKSALRVANGTGRAGALAGRAAPANRWNWRAPESAMAPSPAHRPRHAPPPAPGGECLRLSGLLRPLAARASGRGRQRAFPIDRGD